jgi:hypothetical protein
LARQAGMAMVENLKIVMRTMEEFGNKEQIRKKEQILNLKDLKDLKDFRN